LVNSITTNRLMSELSPTKPIKFSDIKKSLTTPKERYLLNNLPTNVRDSCTTAYGLRRLLQSYTGPVVRARRSSDNAYDDFYADESGSLTNASGTGYLDWLGTATGYLAKWYDQSGTGKDIGNGEYRNQPILSTTQEYPPAAMTADTSVLSGNRYGNGTFIASASSSNVLANIHDTFRAFDKNTTTTFWLSENNVSYFYNATTGLYEGISSLGGISGEWLKLQLPEPIVLTTYSISPRQDYADNRTPKEYKILGSNDNTNWTVVDDRTGSNALADWTTAARSFSTINKQPFMYYAIVITVNGNSGATNRVATAIGEWTLNALSDPEIIYDGSYSSLETMETHVYPPAPLTSDNQTVLMAFPPPMSADTDVIDGQTYIASASSNYNPEVLAIHGIFSDSVNSQWHSAILRYNDTTGAYTGSVSTTAGETSYNGEWVQIQLPTAIKLHTYTMMSRELWSQRAPSSFVVLGSNDGSTWALVHDQTGVTGWADRTQLTFTPNSNTAYTYFRLVVRIVGSSGPNRNNTNIAQWRLFTNSIASLSPPGPMTANTTTISGQTYVASASSFSSDGRFPWTAFDSDSSSFWNQRIAGNLGNLYDSSTGVYTGSNSLGGVRGEWLKLQVPSAVVLHNYTIHPRIGNTNIRNVKEYKVLGSTDDVTWTVLDDRTGSRALANWSGNTAARTFSATNVSQAYLYFAIVITVTGDSGATGRIATAIQQWQLRTTPVPNTFKTSGTYAVSASSSHPSFPGRLAFDNVLSSSSMWHSSDSSSNFTYNQTTGLYSGITNTIAKNINYSGEWLQIKLPKAINVGSFTITPRQESPIWTTRSPRSFVLLGSNDGSNWNLVDEETNVNDWTQATKTFVVNGTGNMYYDHFRIVVRRVGNSDSGSAQVSVQISELKFIESSVPIAPGDDTYTFVADWTPTNTSASVIIEQNTSTIIASRRAVLLRVDSMYGFNGESNDAHTLVPYVANVNKKSVMMCDHTSTGINVKVVDNGTVYNGTTATPSSLDVGGNYFVIGRKINFTEYHSGLINEVILFRDAVPIDAALRYTSATDIIKSNVPDPVPDLWLDFHPKDTTAMHNNFGLYTDAACDIGMLQTLADGVGVSTWNGYTQATSGNRPIYFNSGGYLNENGLVRFDRANSQHLSGGTRTLNIATNGGFTGVVLARFTGSVASWERLFDFGSGQAVDNINLARQSTNTTMTFSMRNGSTVVGLIDATNVIVQNEWAVFACRYNAATRFMEVFKNGVVMGTATASTAVTNRSCTTTYIGRSAWTVDSYFNGDIGGIYIIDKFLTDTELSAVTAQMMYPLQPARLPNSLIPKTQGYVLYEPFRNGYAARFNGNLNTYIDIQQVPALPLSFSFWFNIQSSAYQTIAGLSDVTGLVQGIQLDYNTAGTTANELRIYVWVNNAWQFGSFTSINTNTWYHLSVRIVNNCIVQAYLNGGANTVNVNASGVTTNSIPARSRLLVGAAGDGTRGFNGYIADFRIFNRILNSAELSLIYTFQSSFQNATIQDTTNYLVNARNFLTEMRPVNKQGTFVPVSAQTRQRTQLQLTSNTVNNSVNVLSHPFRIQDYESFTCSFEVWIHDATADWLYFFAGSKIRELPSGPESDNDAVFVNFQVYNHWSGQSPGIGIHKNGKLVSSRNTTNWIGTGTWYPVTIKYNKRAKDTWTVNFNGDEVCRYSDPDVLAPTQRSELTGINTDGLICYFDPGNNNCYPGTGNQLYSLVGDATGTLTGTYQFMGGNVRLVNTTGTTTSNTSTLQLNNSLSGIQTVSIWYYQHSSPAGRYLLDMRTGIQGYIWSGGIPVGTFWNGKTLYKNGSSAQTVTWSNIETLGVWQNITLVSTTSVTDDITLFGRFNQIDGLDVTFGPIFVYNRAITEAENLANYNAVLNSKNLRCWGIGAASFGASMNSYIRRLELSYTESAKSAGAIVRSGALGNSTEVRLSNLYSKPRGLVDGLTYKVYYNGYWDTNVNFFNTHPFQSIGRTSDFTNLRTSTNGDLFNGVGLDDFSVEWFGYFRPHVSGTWTVTSGSDDASSIWIGSTALSGYTTSNHVARTLLGGSTGSGTISLVAGQFYPIRIIFGERGGAEEIYFTFTPPGGTALRNLSGMVFSSIGMNADFPAESAKVIKAISNTNEDGMYYINCNGVSTPTYCLMNDAYDGGGWMMMMKGTRGTTFNFDSTHWTTTSTLNPGNANRDDGDAKYDTYNYQNIQDVLAIFPDVPGTGSVSVRAKADNTYLNYYYNLDPAANVNFNNTDGDEFLRLLRENNYDMYVSINNTVVHIYALHATGGSGILFMQLKARNLTGANVSTSTFTASDANLTITPIGKTYSGSLTVPDGWTWKLENWNAGTRATALSGFQTARDATPSNPYVFSGYNGTVWSHETTTSRHVIGGASHISPAPVQDGQPVTARWGMIFNNEADFNTCDAWCGIGLKGSHSNVTYNYSAGDFGWNSQLVRGGLRRSMRFEMYGR
jgi:hypothetical protein